MNTTIKFIRKSEFLNAQEKFKGQSGYPFSKVVLVPVRNKFDSHYLTGLTKDEETFYEKELGLKEGELKNTSSFWSNFSAEIVNSVLVLEENSIYDQLKLKFLNEIPNIAKSLRESKENSVSDFVIINEEKEIKNSSSVRELKDKAVIYSGKLSDEDFENYLKLKGIYTKSLSKEKIKDLVLTDRDNNPAKFLNVFNDKNFKIKLFISELVDAKVLSIRGTGYLHIAQNEMIGSTIEQVIEFIQNPKNQNIVAALKQEITKS